MTSRAKFLAAGLALIALTNAIALGGAWYNRSGTPDSTLALTERELTPSYAWGRDEENSGVTMHLRVRSANRESDDGYWPYEARLFDLEWLTDEKLAALGFDVTVAADAEKASRFYRRQLPRYAYLVLELDGPAYEQTLKFVRKAYAEAQRDAAAHPDDKNAQGKLDMHRNWLAHEEQDSTRLFVVDAGPDLEALRTKYPDRTRYAIARGHVSVTLCAPQKKQRPCGFIEGLEVPSINVPFDLQRVFTGARPYYGGGESVVTYTAQVSWGRRLEPWLVSVEPGAPRQAPSNSPVIRSR